MARERGTDTLLTSRDICMIRDETTESVILIGGRGNAEGMVDFLRSERHVLTEVNYRGNKQFYNVLLHSKSQMCGVSLPLGGVESVIFWPKAATALDLRLYKPGVPKEATRMEIPGLLAKRNLEEGGE